jgi:hypothetical protein
MAPLSPSALVPCPVNAGSVAARVVVGPEVPPLVVVCAGVVLVGVVAVVPVRARAVAPVVCAGAGVLATVTVFVAEPHPPSSAPADTPRTSVIVDSRLRLIASMVFVARIAPPRWDFWETRSRVDPYRPVVAGRH